MSQRSIGSSSVHRLQHRFSKCRLCSITIKIEDGDDVANGLCSACSAEPEADDLASVSCASSPLSLMSGARPAFASQQRSRSFTAADLSLIRRVGSMMPPSLLLGVLNDRLVADIGSHVPMYSLEQLQDAVAQAHGEAAAQRFSRDWPSLRKLLARARREGLLAKIDEQVINDFAVVFQLTTKQTLELKDVVLPATLEA